MDRIGFIGLGRMGKPMASNMCRKGFRLSVYDVNEAAMNELAMLQARPASSVADVAVNSDVVITMLPNTAIVDDVIARADGALSGLNSGALIMDMSTIDPLVTDRLAAQSRAKRIGFVDSPVGRLASHADRGESLFMVGATEADFQRVKPMLEAMGSTIHHCGGPGTGMRTKLVNNYLAVVSCQLNAEALALSQRLGLSLAKTLKVLYGTTAVNGQLKIAWPDKVLKGDIEPGFTIDLAHKDISLIVEVANQTRVPMPVGAAAREAYSTARAKGFGMRDFSAMVDVLCEIAAIDRPRL
jgi:4-hydroxybutyrate dehydrogenase / sulfolactaldehyde 3-reductase